MTSKDYRRDFESILAALHERELTAWERERLWTILAEHPELEAEFHDHCFLASDLGGISARELAAGGIERPPSNVLRMPAAVVQLGRRSRLPLWSGAAAAVAAGLLALAVYAPPSGDGELPAVLPVGGGSVPAPELSTPEAPPPSQQQADEVTSPQQLAPAAMRRAGLSLDDPSDEGVALAGAAALANSRNPRGGEGSGVHVSAPVEISFNHHVRPILSENCSFCHGTDDKTREADLRLDSFEGATRDLGGYAAIVPGDHQASELWARIIDSGDPMPPVKSHRTLSEADKEILRRWIDSGARYDTHWAFKRIERPAVPAVPDAEVGEATNPVDAFVQERLAQEGLSQSPRAGARTLARRLHLDLVGLPPSGEELSAFVAAFEPDPDAAVSARVDELLASPHYGERMSLAWLDAARYADSNGFQKDGNRNQWPWRDWVVQAFNDNMPFDRFTIEQLAGDLLPDPTTDQLIATAFNRNHMLNGEGGAIPEEQRINYVVDRVDTTATTWLGLTMACAQCHSHKYDPITHRDYFEFFAFFNSVPESGVVDKRVGNQSQLGGKSTVEVGRPFLRLPDEALEKERARLEAQRDKAKQALPVMADFEAKVLAEQGCDIRFVDLEPTAFRAENQRLAVDDSKAVYAEGPNPFNDTYTVTYKVPEGFETIRHLRLLPLQHPSHTNEGKGLARSDSGNFVLTEIEIVHAGQPVAIGSAQASYEQRRFPIGNTFDGNPKTGWAVHRAKPVVKPEVATFTLQEALAVAPGQELQVTLRHDSQHESHNIGRFRLSAARDSEHPLPEKGSLANYLLLPVAVREGEEPAELAAARKAAFPDIKAKEKAVAALDKRIAALDKQFPDIMVMQDQPGIRKTHILERGNYLAPTEEVGAGTPAFLPGLPEDAPRNRLGLANWMVSRENPLVARVVVNRFWQQFFGIGLVKTAEDFGVQGELPSHPELLDWLAVEFIESGWDVKHLVRLLVTSDTYLQSSAVTPEQLEADPQNRLLARASRYRLPAMLLRDQALAAGGLLRLDLGGPPVYPHQPEGLWKEFSFDQIHYPHADSPEHLHRRSLYTFWRRTSPPPNMFDSATRQVCTVKSSITNTPLQALTMLNDVTFVEAARGLGARMAAASEDPQKSLAFGFEVATGRPPENAELAVLEDGFVSSLEEFQVDPEATQSYALVDAPRLAAFTRTAQVLLNLDETLNRN